MELSTWNLKLAPTNPLKIQISRAAIITGIILPPSTTMMARIRKPYHNIRYTLLQNLSSPKKISLGGDIQHVHEGADGQPEHSLGPTTLVKP